MDKISALNIAGTYIDFLKHNHYNIQKAYLFGSYAKNTFTDDSDIDLAIILDKISNRFDLQVKLMMLTKDIDARIEPHPFDIEDFTSANPFAKEIMFSGIELKNDTIH